MCLFVIVNGGIPIMYSRERRNAYFRVLALILEEGARGIFIEEYVDMKLVARHFPEEERIEWFGKEIGMWEGDREKNTLYSLEGCFRIEGDEGGTTTALAASGKALQEESQRTTG